MNSAPRPWSCSSYHSHASPISRTALSETVSRYAMYAARCASELLPREIRLRDRPRTRRDGDRARPLTHPITGPPPVQRRCCPRSARPGGYARQWAVQESQRLKSASCFVAYHCWSSAPTSRLSRAPRRHDCTRWLARRLQSSVRRRQVRSGHIGNSIVGGHR